MGIIARSTSVSSWTATLCSHFVPFFALVRDEASESFIENPDIGTIIFDGGRLMVDRFTVQNPEFREDAIAWSQTSNRGFTSGHLYYGRSGTELQGVICIGDSAEDAVTYDVLATAVPLSEYATQTAARSVDAAWADAPILRVGYRPGEDFASRIAVFLDETDLSRGAAFTLDPATGRPVLTVLLPDTGELTGMARVSFEIGRNGAVTFAGHIRSDDEKIRRLSWQGERLVADDIESALVEQRPPLLFVTPELPDVESALEEPEEIDVQERNAINDLVMRVPDDAKVADDTFTYLLENMKWAMAQDTRTDDIASRRTWLESFYRERAPIITDPSRIGTIQQHADWYRDKMATAIFGNAISDQELPKDLVPRPVDAERRRQLKAYLEKCLGTQSEFVSQQQAIWRTVYLDKSRGLHAYADEDAATVEANGKPGAEKRKTWAQRVLDFFTRDSEYKKLTDNMFGGGTQDPSTVDLSEDDEAIAGYDKRIATTEARIARNVKKLEALMAEPEPDQDEIEDMKATIEDDRERVKDYAKSKADKEHARSERIERAAYQMKNVSSLLFALDPTGAASKTYMDTCGGAVMTHLAANTNINEIPDYEKNLTEFMQSFLRDLSTGRIKPFGSLDDEFQTEMNALLREQALSAEDLGKHMVQALVAARGRNFLESANLASVSFASRFPKLTTLFRLGLIAAYGYTVFLVMRTITTGMGNMTATEKAEFFGTVAMMTVETYRSLLPNIKGLFKPGAEPNKIVAYFRDGKIHNVLRRIASGIASAFKAVVSGVRSAASTVAHAMENKVFAWLRTAFSKIIASVSQVARTVGNKFSSLATAMADWFKSSSLWSKIGPWLGRAMSVLAKGLTIVSSIWATVTEGINLVKMLKSDKPGWEKALTSIQFVAIAASSVATIVGLFASSVVWSGAGAVLALAALGIGFLIAKLFPPESPIQKAINQVIVPFIDNEAIPAVAALTAASAANENTVLETMAVGQQSAMAPA